MKAPVTAERLDRVMPEVLDAISDLCLCGGSGQVIEDHVTDLIEALRIAREALEDIKVRYDEEGRFAARDMWRVAYEALDEMGGRRG